MKICACIILAVLMLVGCEGRTERVAKYREVSNVRTMSGNYIHYEIENGKVTCRDHLQRSELACWNKVSE